jgi:hypothetical protein
MPLRVQPFLVGLEAAVKDFNRRMSAAGSRWQFPESSVPSWLAPAEGSPIFQDFFVAADGDVVRGAYALQRRPALLAGEEHAIGAWYLPISEGIVDRRHALVAPQLLRDAIQRAPLSFGLGMDGMDSQLSKLVGSLCCERRPVPFFARIEQGGRFAREASYVRRKAVLRGALDIAAATGLARFGAELVKLALRRGPGLGGASVETVPDFGAWADEIWERCRGRYSFVERRDAATLTRIFPVAPGGFERLRISRARRPIGWAVLEHREQKRNRTYGSLHVGRISDCFAAPEDAEIVIRAAADALAARGVELMLSNQLHPAWGRALRRNAFLPVPSNYVFAPTAPLAERIHAIDPEMRGVHLNRGDGDGPWGQIRRGFWKSYDGGAARRAQKEIGLG